jgi:DHA2 family lincomycin resistance protein-like MFS transporter
VILNETLVVNALPKLMHDFTIDERTAQWASSIFMLGMAAVIPLTGWFLQRVTTRTAYFLAMGTFVAGTVLAAIAPTFGSLLAARAIQSAGTAVMMPLLMTTLMTVVDPRDRGRVMGNVMLAISVAPALGPTVSGVIVTQLGQWRLLFVVMLPIALLITFLGARYLKNIGEPQVSKVSWLSVGLAAVGFSTLAYGLSEMGARSSAWLASVIGIGAVLVVAFVMYQLRLQKVGTPLMDLRTLNSRTFSITLVLMAASFMAFIGTMLLFPIYFQQYRGWSAMQSGLMVLPGGLAMGLLGPRIGHLYDRIGSRPLVIPGALIMVATIVAMSRIGLSTPVWLIVGEHVVLMVSLAALFTPVFTLALGVLPQHLYSHGSSILGTTQQVAGAMGTALLIAILKNRTTDLANHGSDAAAAFMGGFQWAFLTAAAFGLIVVVLSLLLPARAEQPASHH